LLQLRNVTRKPLQFRVPEKLMAGSETQGDRIYAVRLARGTGNKPQGVESFAGDMNSLLPREEHARSTTVWRWERGEGSPSVLQGLAIVALDPENRGLAWFAGNDRLSRAAGLLPERGDEDVPIPPGHYPVPRGDRPIAVVSDAAARKGKKKGRA
jgi:hypothetical protein